MVEFVSFIIFAIVIIAIVFICVYVLQLIVLLVGWFSYKADNDVTSKLIVDVWEKWFIPGYLLKLIWENFIKPIRK